MRMVKRYLTMAVAFLTALASWAAPTGEPAITFQSTAYAEIGESNLCSILLGTINTADYTVVDASGERTLTVVPATFDASSGNFYGTWTQIKVPESGEVRIYGDPANIDVIVAEGLYVTSVDMPAAPAQRPAATRPDPLHQASGHIPERQSVHSGDSA